MKLDHVLDSAIEADDNGMAHEPSCSPRALSLNPGAA
jgi:hypothetical protein